MEQQAAAIGTGHFEELVRRELELSANRGDFFSSAFGLPVSLPISRAFLRFNISENVATLLMLLVGVGGAALLASTQPVVVALGFFLLLCHHVLDYVDGQLARHRGVASVLGAARDRWVHFVVQNLTYLLFALGLYRSYGTALASLPIFTLYFWNALRQLLSGMPTLILINELRRYPAPERDQMLRDYRRSVGPIQSPPAEAPRSEMTARNGLVAVRTASTSFNFLTLIMMLAASFDAAFNALAIDLHLLLGAATLMGVYALCNILDFSRTYLFSDRIYTDIRRVESGIGEA